MKALFCTTATNEVDGHVSAWDSAFGACERVTFDHRGIRNDWQLGEAAERVRPQVIFYIGACEAPGNPRPETLAALRKYAPTINLVSDAADRPWHKPLMAYRARGCFDLQVAIDGGGNDAPVDHETLTPVDTRYFAGPEGARDIRCGFSGSVGRWKNRSEMVNALEWFGGLTVRRREKSRAEANGYEGHVRFLKRCRMLLNVSFTGTQNAHHIKGRVLEAGWAGCCLLEHAASPIARWFPKDSYFTYSTAREAAALIDGLSDREIAAAADRFARHVRENYTPTLIYGGILKRMGLAFPS